jgi:hypothetical protein
MSQPTVGEQVIAAITAAAHGDNEAVTAVLLDLPHGKDAEALFLATSLAGSFIADWARQTDQTTADLLSTYAQVVARRAVDDATGPD